LSLTTTGALLFGIYVRKLERSGSIVSQKGLAAGLLVITSSALSMLIESSRGILFNFILGSIFAIGRCFFFANPDINLGHIPHVLLKSKKRQGQ